MHGTRFKVVPVQLLDPFGVIDDSVVGRKCSQCPNFPNSMSTARAPASERHAIDPVLYVDMHKNEANISLL